MVSEWKRNDEFALMMDESIHFDAFTFECRGGCEESFMTHELRTAFVVVGEVGSHDGFEFFAVVLVYRVPLFRCSEMDVIYRVQIHILFH
jgi:hypothetical protein